jgi:hypothetical protein
MTTYGDFIRFIRIEDSVFPTSFVIRATNWKETTKRRGSLRPAFDGTMLSTLRTPKRTWTARFDFMTGVEWDAFQAYTGSTGVSPGNQQESFRKMVMYGLGPESVLRNHGAQVYIQIDGFELEEYLDGAFARLMYHVDVTILEA